jgi:hypothetical protein
VIKRKSGKRGVESASEGYDRQQQRVGKQEEV